MTVWRYILRSSDPVVRAVVFEDSAALVGLSLAASGLLLSRILKTSVPDSLASLLIGLLLAVTAFGLARPFADFLVGRSLPAPLLEKLHTIVKEDAAIEQILSLRAMYSGPEEVVVMAKIHPSARMNIEQLTRSMDDLDHRIRLALPFVADVFIDVTASRAEEKFLNSVVANSASSGGGAGMTDSVPSTFVSKFVRTSSAASIVRSEEGLIPFHSSIGRKRSTIGYSKVGKWL